MSQNSQNFQKKFYVRYFQKRRDTQFVNYYEEKIQFMQ